MLGLVDSCRLLLLMAENPELILSKAVSLYVDIGSAPAKAKTKNKAIKENTVNVTFRPWDARCLGRLCLQNLLVAQAPFQVGVHLHVPELSDGRVFLFVL
jgi:hypothetical protein